MEKFSTKTTLAKKAAAILVAASAMLVVVTGGASPAAADVNMTSNPTSDARHFQSKSGIFQQGGCKLFVQTDFHGIQSTGFGKVQTTVGFNHAQSKDCGWFRVINTNKTSDYNLRATPYQSVYGQNKYGSSTGTIVRTSKAAPYKTEVCMRLKSDYLNLRCETFWW